MRWLQPSLQIIAYHFATAAAGRLGRIMERNVMAALSIIKTWAWEVWLNGLRFTIDIIATFMYSEAGSTSTPTSIKVVETGDQGDQRHVNRNWQLDRTRCKTTPKMQATANHCDDNAPSTNHTTLGDDGIGDASKRHHIDREGGTV